MLFIQKNLFINHPKVGPQVTEIDKLEQITENVIDVSTHIPLKALMIHLKRVKLRGVLYTNQCSNAIHVKLCAHDVHHKKCGLGSLISAQVKKTS